MKLVWTREAIADCSDVHDYIEADNPAVALGELFLEKAEQLIDYPNGSLTSGRTIGKNENERSAEPEIQRQRRIKIKASRNRGKIRPVDRLNLRHSSVQGNQSGILTNSSNSSEILETIWSNAISPSKILARN